MEELTRRRISELRVTAVNDQGPSTTAEREPSRAHEEIIKEAKRIGEDCLYSCKSQFAAAQFWSWFHLVTGLAAAVLAAVAAFAVVNDRETLAGGSALVASALSAVITFINANERAGSHQRSGNEYDALLNRVRIFWTIECWGGNSDNALTEKL